MEYLNTEHVKVDDEHLECRTCKDILVDERFAKNPTLPHRRGREYECKKCAKLVRLVNKVKRMSDEEMAAFEAATIREYEDKMKVINLFKGE